MSPEENREAEEYFAAKRGEITVPVLNGWEHSCGFHTDDESLFIQHIEHCSSTTQLPEPIYREVLEHFRMRTQIDD